MIAFLRGRPVTSGPDHVVLDVGGIGYKVFVPTSVIGKMADPQTEVTVHTYLHVREDALQLFGFLEDADRGIFELLIQVSGIGPKVALAVLSSTTTPAFVQAVINEQINLLTQIPGVGKKTAQRVIVELKDKFGKMDVAADADIPGTAVESYNITGDALQALVALGYNPVEAKRVLGRVTSANKDIELEETVRLALKELAKF